ncbi:hypothetical protein [Brevibacterium ihuae]|uniref:hypothetical protein n=1 Tax=Brevibacterium ihuae TaxID=1631743 RepID=UPI000C76BAAD|nr:hypothetical protein [Brevibacterium ihuae]
MNTQRFKAVAGYAALLVSAVGYLVCRVVLVGYMESGVGVVETVPIGIALGVLAVAAGAVGAWLLVPERRLAVVLGLGFLLVAGPTLLGAIVNLTDFLSATGYNAFGALNIMVGNSVLPFGAVLALLIAGWSAVRQLRRRGRQQPSRAPH